MTRLLALIFIQLTEVFYLANAMTCGQDISIVGVGISTSLGAFQEIGQIYAANRSTLLGTKVTFSYDSISSSLLWPRVLHTSSDNKTALFTFTDAPSGSIAELAYWTSVPLMAGCQGIIYNLASVPSLNITFLLLAKIFTGNITLWNDKRLQQLNPSVKLPNIPIVPVGRYESSGDTHDFTTALSTFSAEWARDYGVFDSPDFYGGICCNSSRWPPAVKLFGSRALGSIGIVGSIPYTIGYASSVSATANNMSIAFVDNRNGTFVYPNDKGAQAAMNYWVKVRKDLTSSDLSGALDPNAYPLVTNYHMSFVNTSGSNPIAADCCTARELLGFLVFLLSDPIQTLVFNKYFLVPISKDLKNRVNTTILQQMTCGQENLYDSYLASLVPKDTTAATVTTFVVIIVGVVIAGLAGVGVFYYRNRRKYLASISSWLVPPERLKPIKEAERPGFRSTVSLSRSATNANRCETSEDLTICLLGDQVVVTMPIPPLDIRRMSLASKRLLYQFHKEFSHENILPFTGLVVAQPNFLSLSLFSGKTTLHSLIHYSNYELSDDIRYNFASDVVQGMKYLHGRQIPHRLLTSLNCYVDRSWRVKVGHWHLVSLLQQENLRDLRLQLSYVGNPTERNELIRLLYLDPLAHKDIGTFSHYADAYSFGLLMFELFAQLLPFEQEVDLQVETYESVLQKKFLLLELPKPEIPPNVPAYIRQLINNCLTDRTNRLHFKAIETGISHCRRSRKGIIDLLMDTMETYMADLEQKVTERTSTMAELNAKLQSLLNEVLPAEIALRLLRGEEVQPEQFESVTIFFSDVVGFTTLSSKSTPMEVMSFLNDLWTVFDSTVEMMDAYKVDTIGDAYMICSGLPRRNGFLHAKVIGNLAIALLEKTKSFTIRHRPNDQLRIRIGINSGPVTAGIVGSKMPQYCVFGDTVNTDKFSISNGIFRCPNEDTGGAKLL